MEKNKAIRVKIQKIAGAIQNNKYIKSISNGLAFTMPALLGGAIFSLINSLNIPAYQDFLTRTGLKTLTEIPAQITTNVISLYAVCSIAYVLSNQFNKDGFPAALMALMSFFIVTPMVTTGKGYAAVTNLPLTWLGAQGFFVAMIVAIVVARLYVLILDKNLYIKMPKGVPPTIEKSFAAVVPALIVLIITLIVRGIFSATTYGNIHQFIYHFIQVPLTKLGGSWEAALIAIVLVSVLWFLGIHGTMIVFTVMTPVWMPMQLENLAAFQKGMGLPNLMPPGTFLSIYGCIGGSAATIGLAISMLFAKSKRYKTLGKLAVFPGLFGINEPLMFGLPIVFNIRLLIPLIAAPLTSCILALIATYSGILPRLRGVGAPVGTPIGVSGLIEGGWRVAIFQLILVAVSFIIYYPFFKKMDTIEYNQEVAAENNTTSEG